MTYRNLRYPVDLIQLLSAALHMSASCVDIRAVINEQLDSLCLYSPSSKQPAAQFRSILPKDWHQRHHQEISEG